MAPYNYIWSKLFRHVLCWIFVSTGCYSLNCQKLIFDHYGPKEGLLSSQVFKICKDSLGNIWAGTESGLIKFDGHEFTTYRNEPGNTETISGDYIPDVVIDKHGRIWISANNNINIIYPEPFRVIRYSDESFNNNNPTIYDLYYNHATDDVWIGTAKGLFYNHGKDICLKREYLIKEDSFNSEISVVRPMSDGSFIIGNNKGIQWINNYNCTYKRFYNFPNDGIVSVAIQNDSIIWAGSWLNGLDKINLKSNRKFNYTWQDPKKNQNGVLSLHFDTESGKLWLGTTDGIKVFDPSNNVFTSYHSKRLFDRYHIAGAGFGFYKDSTFGLWIGTYNGLYRYDPNKNIFNDIPLTFNNINDIVTPENIQFESHPEGKDSIIWFTSSYGQIYRYDIINNKEVEIPGKFRKYCKGKISPFVLYLDNRENLWSYSYIHGLNVYDIKKDRMLKVNAKDKYLSISQILPLNKDSLLLASNDTFYVAGINDEITLAPYPGIDNKVKAYGVIPLYSLSTLDSMSTLWFLCYNKQINQRVLFNYRLKSKVLTYFDPYKYPEINQLSHIQGMEQVSKNEILVYSNKGACTIKNKISDFDFTTLKFTPYNQSTGFQHAINFDLDNIIFSNDFGLLVYNKKSKLTIPITNESYSLEKSHQPALLQSPNSGKIYFIHEGIIQTFKTGATQFISPPDPIITSMKINGALLPVVPKSGTEIKLKYNQNNIHINLSNHSYTNSDDNIYFYRLQTDDDWVINNGHKLIFSSLSPGDYHLQIKSTNCFNKFSTKLYNLNMIISPPFYKTWWFGLLIIAGISTIIFYYFRLKDLQRQKLEKLRHTIARDLHDDMGSNLSYIKMLSEKEALNSDNKKVFVNIADKTTELMTNMSEIIWSINPQYDNLRNIIIRIQEFASETLEQANIRLKFQIEDLPENIMLSPEDRRNFFLIFKEAINNASKYSRATQAVLTFTMEKNWFFASFEDNGTGFDRQIIKLGNGLKNMESRAKLLDAQFSMTTGHGGTRIELRFKP